MNIFKLPLLVAAVFTAAVFAQSADKEEKSGAKLRFSGDFYINPAYEMQNDWQDKPEDGDKLDAFNVLYNWNTSFGVDFGDKFSLDFRLSNKAGYECDNLAFKNGSVKELLPYLPNAYFTWKAGEVFSLSGGLLEVSDNTVLNLAAGYETGGGLYTSFANWATAYNNSQGGLKIGFDFSENFSLRLTAALASETNTFDYAEEDYIHNEFRFILDADIALGEKVTLSPVFQSRSYWQNYTVGDKKKNSILLAYGTDLNVEFSESVNLGLGLAFGNIKGKGLDVETNGEKNSAFGFLAGVNPEFTFGVNEVAAGYSFGRASDQHDKKKDLTTMYHDMYLCWLFRVNDYLALGPSAYAAIETSKTDNSDVKSGYNWQRFGIEFVGSF
ncbi:MAG: hypothetical protein LBH98_01375 [Chitinispirillales bacterium]|jgi:hypothetical protein|nr:hypothetical protein [Chitinispirillales bacterium]